jgi:hypothetical protein
MAILKAKTRNSLPSKDFGEPGERKYPMPDRSHAANAKARAKQQLDAGRLSRSEYSTIVAKANRKLGEEKQDKKNQKDLDDYIGKKYGKQ